MELQDEQAIFQTQALIRLLYVSALSFLGASASGMALPVRDGRYRDLWHLVSIGICSGFVGLCCVAFVCWIAGGSHGNGWLLAFITFAVGLSGKKVESLPYQLLEWALERMGVELVDNRKDESNAPHVDSAD